MIIVKNKDLVIRLVTMSFVHLHTHSHYSLLDGLPKIPELVAKAKEHGCPAMAITDHGVMYGAIEFYKAAKAAGIKPIIGLEAYLAFGDRTEKRARVDDDYYHVTLLAKDLEGYKNLMQLTTIAHLEGFYYKPRIDKTVLREHSAGLIALSGCLRGEIARSIVGNQYDKAKTLLKEYQEIFGAEDFYLEVQYHPEIPEQEKVNQGLKKLATETGAPLVATTDSHYLSQMDRDAQDILVCVQTGKMRTETNRLDMRGVDLALKTPEVMENSFRDYPNAVTNTLRIAEKCNVELTLGKWLFPNFATPDNLSVDEYLRQLAYAGFKIKFPEQTEEVRQRLEYELDIIQKKGYSPYFLIVADYVNWTRDQGIIATTRGSAAGSIVSYLIGVTTVDPLKFKLPFERFLNLSRPSPPDIDMDFADNRRDEVIAYVKEKYGADKVAQIITFGTLQARAAVRDVTRVLGLAYSFGDKLAKLIPIGPQGMHMTIDRALEMTPELAELYKTDNQVTEVLDLARRIEGCVRHASVHAAGIVIAPTPLTDYTPLQKEPGGENIITQYDMHAVEDAGLLKMDFLGIRNLSILGDAVRITKKTKGVEVDLLTLPLDDKVTYDLLAKGETMGVFQLSGSGMTRYLVELKPNSINDIMAMVALFRPGPMESIPEYIRRKHNPELVKYLDPRMEEILSDSYGILTYQDDVLLTAIKLAGYTWEEADKLRKAIGKKIPKEMAAQEEKFTNGCIKNGLAKAKAKELWGLIEPFAAYGFGRAHAASYAVVAYQTAYMKAHFPAEFMTAIMTAESGDNEKVAEVIMACRQMDIKVLPPDVNESLSSFTYVNDKQIRFGLLAIKNLGSDIIECIIEERKQHGLFKSIEDLLYRIKNKNLNKKSLESLAKAGALDIFGDRGVLLNNTERMLAYHKEIRDFDIKKQASLFAVANAVASAPPLKLSAGAPLDAETKLQWEKELLGLYVSAHPFTKYEPYLSKDVVSCGAINEENQGQVKTIAGIVISCKPFTTRKGDSMLVAQLEDMVSSCEVVAFPRVYGQTKELWQEGMALYVVGKVEASEGRRRILCEKAARIEINGVKSSASSSSSAPTRLVISLLQPDAAILNQLKACLLSYPGDLLVELCLPSPDGFKTLRTGLKAQNSETCRQAVKEITGVSQVQVV